MSIKNLLYISIILFSFIKSDIYINRHNGYNAVYDCLGDDKGENENIEEALGKLYFCNESYNNLTTDKLKYIFEVIEKTPQQEILSKCNIYG